MYLLHLWADDCTVAGSQKLANDDRYEGGSAMYDSFSEGTVYYGRALIALSGVFALAILFQLL